MKRPVCTGNRGESVTG